MNFGIQVLLGLCLHSFVEGMPLSSYPHLHGSAGMAEGNVNHLLYGIILHKAPAAFALVVLLLQSNFSRLFILSSLIVFSFMSPLGAFVTEILVVGETATTRIMAIVVGSFLHISTTILFEADDTHHHTISWWKLLAIIIGFGIALLTTI